MNLIVYLLIIFGAAFRIFSNASGFDFFPPNFAPIGAMALFGGYYLPRRQAFIVPLAATFVADLIIGFYEPLVMLSVYLSFILVTFIGQLLAKQKNAGFTVGGVFVSSILFFLITNFAVWVNPGSTYADNFSGLLQSYILGLPFLKFTLLGDLFFNGVFFGSLEVAKRFVKVPRLI